MRKSASLQGENSFTNDAQFLLSPLHPHTTQVQSWSCETTVKLGSTMALLGHGIYKPYTAIILHLSVLLMQSPAWRPSLGTQLGVKSTEQAETAFRSSQTCQHLPCWLPEPVLSCAVPVPPTALHLHWSSMVGVRETVVLANETLLFYWYCIMYII